MARAGSERKSIMATWNQQTFGTEIECYAPVDTMGVARILNAAGIPTQGFTSAVHRTTSEWKVVTDGSVHGNGINRFGVEVVSPVLRGVEGLEQLRKVLEALEAAGCTVDRACGIHVHVGMRGASGRQIANVAKAYLRHEGNFDKLIAPSRRAGANRFCQSNRTQAIRGHRSLDRAFDALDNATTGEQVARIVNGGFQSGVQYSGYRYFGLNLQSLGTHGTVEFRSHGGSVNAAKVCAWVRLVTGFVAAAVSARQIPSTDDATLAQLLRCTDAVGHRFLQDRADHFAGRAAA
jgi:hypothetical protein